MQTREGSTISSLFPEKLDLQKCRYNVYKLWLHILRPRSVSTAEPRLQCPVNWCGHV